MYKCTSSYLVPFTIIILDEVVEPALFSALQLRTASERSGSEVRDRMLPLTNSEDKGFPFKNQSTW